MGKVRLRSGGVELAGFDGERFREKEEKGGRHEKNICADSSVGFIWFRRFVD
jgi:hypothetical protein